MNKDKKPKRPAQTSPVGVAVWPHLNKADEYTTPQGAKKIEFKTRVRYTPAEAAPIIKACAAVMEEAKAEATARTAGKRDKKGKPIQVTENDLYTVEVDQEGNETGFYLFSFSSKNKPALFDAAGKPINDDIWGGTRLKVSYTPSPYYVDATQKYGVKLYLNACQIIDLVTKGSRNSGDASRFGFSKEDGYEAPTGETMPEEGDTGEANVAAQAKGEF